VDGHDCLDNLEYHEYDSIEAHGLDCGPFERFHDEWWECAICGERFTERNLMAIQKAEERP
jgi:hypothetical protein